MIFDCYRGDEDDGDWLSWIACADAFGIDVMELVIYFSLGHGIDQRKQRKRLAHDYYAAFLEDPWI